MYDENYANQIDKQGAILSQEHAEIITPGKGKIAIVGYGSQGIATKAAKLGKASKNAAKKMVIVVDAMDKLKAAMAKEVIDVDNINSIINSIHFYNTIKNLIKKAKPNTQEKTPIYDYLLKNGYLNTVVIVSEAHKIASFTSKLPARQREYLKIVFINPALKAAHEFYSSKINESC